MGGVISSLFQLVLGVFSKLALDAINKDLGVPKVLLEESFELRRCNQSDTFVTALLLDLSEADGAMEKCGGKRV